MASFRQQMQELADKIARSRSERHQTVSQLSKTNEQFRRQCERTRDQARRELQRTAGTLARELSSFNAGNKRSVQRFLRDTRQSRLNQGQTMRSRLTREVSKNRSDILRQIQQNHAERKRMQRSQSRQSLLAIQNVHHRVETLRTGTQRMVRSLALDRGEARKIWNNLRRHATTSYASSNAVGRAIAATANKPTVAALNLSTGDLTGLSMPPTSV